MYSNHDKPDLEEVSRNQSRIFRNQRESLKNNLLNLKRLLMELLENGLSRKSKYT